MRRLILVLMLGLALVGCTTTTARRAYLGVYRGDAGDCLIVEKGAKLYWLRPGEVQTKKSFIGILTIDPITGQVGVVTPSASPYLFTDLRIDPTTQEIEVVRWGRLIPVDPGERSSRFKKEKSA